MRLPTPELEAVAEAWASIDGRLGPFKYGRKNRHSERAKREGYYEGYIYDAEELIRRLRRRGFDVMKLGSVP